MCRGAPPPRPVPRGLTTARRCNVSWGPPPRPVPRGLTTARRCNVSWGPTPTTCTSRSHDRSAVQCVAGPYPRRVPRGSRPLGCERPRQAFAQDRRRSGDGHARGMSGPVAAMARDEPPRARRIRLRKCLSASGFDAHASRAGRTSDCGRDGNDHAGCDASSFGCFAERSRALRRMHAALA